ncbi:ABC transporter ATP-binding protein [Pectinatus haikarae]|uniref:NitT/TauT family transport system ATP-binding protein/sulfonate transport system ATP-binding protein n=2 Tax=Pectinatus haikarae TaxID=349096 RepID=A0ABT9Y9X2_9FIRM|nr:ABC transporter ATP-binding protein [Pectinatus haikarae]MDQ0204521.1 NitT/TauT family transport system ATP-binding protein/sulfonate transport system ATP-binding protein [Pectinatus haikarae]
MVGAVNINSVTKKFAADDGSEITALNGIDLKVRAGEFISLIGPSGCGKSTLLRLIAGLSKPTEGTLFIDESEIKGTSYERGLVFQNAMLFPWLNIYDNIAFGLKARKVYRSSKDRVKSFISMVSLDGFEKSFPHQLSGGMIQRAGLARVLINDPKVLLLDEPLGALDAFTRMNLQDELIRIWKKEKMTMILVTHDVDEAVYLSDRIVVMTPRPAKIEKIIDVNLSYPRARSGSEFLYLRTQILKILNYAGKTEEPGYYI